MNSGYMMKNGREELQRLRKEKKQKVYKIQSRLTTKLPKTHLVWHLLGERLYWQLLFLDVVQILKEKVNQTPLLLQLIWRKLVHQLNYHLIKRLHKVQLYLSSENTEQYKVLTIRCILLYLLVYKQSRFIQRSLIAG